MLPFGGWDMPIQYKGVLDEHRACREDAAIFDVSHLGTVECADPDAFALLQWLLTNDLNRIAPGRAQYTHLLDADDAHVVDDIIVWWVERDRFFVMPNASNTDDLMGAMRQGVTRVGKAVGFADITASRAVLAVQGPNARERLATVSAEAAAVARFDVRPVGDWVVAGTGYTGEDGVEIHVAAADAPALWDAIVAAGVTPAAWARVTRCGSRQACRCTGTSSVPASHRCRPGWAGSCASTRARSGGARRCSARRMPVSRVSCAGSRSRAASPRVKVRPSSTTAPRSAW